MFNFTTSKTINMSKVFDKKKNKKKKNNNNKNSASIWPG